MTALQSSDGGEVTNMVDVSILIVCYKVRHLIAQCLEGIYAHTSGYTYEVLLVDCSNDGAVDLVRSEFPDVRIVDNSENLGFGRGNNLLAVHATGRYLLLLNPDTIVSDNAIGNLYSTALAFPKAGAIGGRSRLPNGSRDLGCRQVIPTLGRIAISAVGGSSLISGWLPEEANEAREVETLHGAFMMVSSEAWAVVDGFDPSFFMYSEEMDLCHRLRQRGYSIVMTPNAEIVHLVGSGKQFDAHRQQLIAQARMHFLRKHWSPLASFTGACLLWLHAFVRYCAGLLGSTFSMKQRAKELRECYEGIVLRPSRWWWGFRSDLQTQSST
jgi:N-acetylglucosaminyl-diphospho-decaprenol L-rhamnosyltransferase